jgi:hypothetical protein
VVTSLQKKEKMPINFKEIKSKIENPELSEQEIKNIEKIEKLIDEEILKQAEQGNCKEIKIQQHLVAEAISIYSKNKIKMVVDILKKNYKEANWKFVELNDAFSEPAVEIWALRGKFQRKIKGEK